MDSCSKRPRAATVRAAGVVAGLALLCGGCTAGAAVSSASGRPAAASRGGRRRGERVASPVRQRYAGAQRHEAAGRFADSVPEPVAQRAPGAGAEPDRAQRADARAGAEREGGRAAPTAVPTGRTPMPCRAGRLRAGPERGAHRKGARACAEPDRRPGYLCPGCAGALG